MTEIEYVNWCFGQPYNIAVVVHLTGVVTVEEVRAAVRSPGRCAAAATPVHSWQLSRDRTAALLHRCRAEDVSVQSALCTAFLPLYTAVRRTGVEPPITLRPNRSALRSFDYP